MAANSMEMLSRSLQESIDAKDIEKGLKILEECKLKLTQLHTLPPVLKKSSESRWERLIGRDVYECGVLLSAFNSNNESLERYLTLLQPFYFEYRDELGDSTRRNEILGLHLLMLIVDSRLTEFHTLLELISLEERENKFVSFVIEVEQYLMEGSYNKVIAAQNYSPSSIYSSLIESLEKTVQEEIATCIEEACPRLSVLSACKLMNLPSVEALQSFVDDRERWSINGSEIVFKVEEDKHFADRLPSHSLVSNLLKYAHEIERIV